MKALVIIAVSIIGIGSVALSQPTNVCGVVSGVWDLAGSPYQVTCDVAIIENQSLIIEPGVRIEFMNHYRFSVYGSLTAVGTASDSIYFTRGVEDDSYNWWGIRFYDSSIDTSIIEYCVIEHSSKGNGNDHDYNGGGVYLEFASPTIRHCTFRYNSASRGSGVYNPTGSGSIIEHCLFYSNSSPNGAIFLMGTGYTRNCTVVQNIGNGLYIGDTSYNTSNIIAYNSGPAISGNSQIESIVFCDIIGDIGGCDPLIGTVTTVNSNGDPCDVYFNIFLDPLMVDVQNNDFRLSEDSPCIDGGDPESPFDPDGTIVDIGCFYYPQPFTVFSITQPNGGEELQLFSSETIRWAWYDSSISSVSIELNRSYPAGSWEFIVDTTENDGEYEWTVSDPLSTECRIRISATTDTSSDISDSSFSIVSSLGYLGLVEPNEPNVPILNWDSGIVECNSSTINNFRLKNFGSEAIVVFQPTEPASDEFSITTSCGSFFALAPGQMSSCTLSVEFSPLFDGQVFDTLLIQTDAVNGSGGYLRIPLSGEQVTTPAIPEVVLTIEGEDALLAWSPVDTSMAGCPISVTRYLVFYAPISDGPFYFHGGTTDTSYTHHWVATYEDDQFYQVIATTAMPALLATLPDASAELTREQVLAMLKR